MKIFERLKKTTSENVLFLKNNEIFKNNFKKYNISDLLIKDNLLDLLRVINDADESHKKHRYSNCPNSTQGLKVNVVYSWSNISFNSSHCPCYAYHFFSQNYLYRDFPDNHLKFNLKQKGSLKNHKNESYLEITKEKHEIINYLRWFCSKISSKDYKNSNETLKGLYISGPPSSGKTYIMTALANWAAKRDFKIVSLNSLSLADDLKSSYNNKNNYALPKKSLLTLSKKCDILFIDDLGNENQKGAWWRDQVLFNLLDSRFKAKKITFISSNFNLMQLKKYYTFNHDYSESIKVTRLFERIDKLCHVQNISNYKQK